MNNYTQSQKDERFAKHYTSYYTSLAGPDNTLPIPAEAEVRHDLFEMPENVKNTLKTSGKVIRGNALKMAEIFNE